MRDRHHVRFRMTMVRPARHSARLARAGSGASLYLNLHALALRRPGDPVSGCRHGTDAVALGLPGKCGSGNVLATSAAIPLGSGDRAGAYRCEPAWTALARGTPAPCAVPKGAGEGLPVGRRTGKRVPRSRTGELEARFGVRPTASGRSQCRAKALAPLLPRQGRKRSSARCAVSARLRVFGVFATKTLAGTKAGVRLALTWRSCSTVGAAPPVTRTRSRS
jgi:hypothetical protein